MTDAAHDQLHSLLGAFVLGAVSPLEHRRVERHLSECDDCTREVKLLGESAAELATLAGETPVDDAFIDQIMNALPRTRRRVMPRLTALAAAAALVVAAAAGGIAIREHNQSRRLAGVLAAASRTAALRPHGDFPGKGTVAAASGRIAVTLDDMPKLEEGRVWQLWAIRDGRPSSIGTLRPDRTITAILPWKGNAEVFAVTAEPAPGSSEPTTTPVLTGSVY